MTSTAAARVAGDADPSSSKALFSKPEIIYERLPDGSIVLRSLRPLGPVPASVGVLLERWAARTPDQPFLAERNPDGTWRKVTYGQASRAVNAIAQSLLDRKLAPGQASGI